MLAILLLFISKEKLLNKKLQYSLVMFLFVMNVQFIACHAQCLSGPYTIGGVNPDFKSIRLAFDSIRKVGICGNIDFNIRPGVYSDSLTLPYIKESDQYRIRIKSENNDSSSVVLKPIPDLVNTINRYVFRLLNSKNITFEKLTFNLNSSLMEFCGIYIQPNSVNSDGIELFNNAFMSDSVKGQALTVENNVPCPIKIKIKNNRFLGTNILIYGNNPDTAASLQINSNVFQGNAAGIHVYTFPGKVNVSDNHITDTLTLAPKVVMIVNAGIIERNYIHLKSGSGIRVGPGFNLSTSYVQVINNYVQVDSSHFPAITIAGGKGLIAFNTIRINSYGNYGSALQVEATTTSIVKNNIIISRGGPRGLIDVIDKSSSIVDYNRYEGVPGIFGKADTTMYPSFSVWKLATGFDAHSQFQKTNLADHPGYKIVGDPDLKNSGTPIPGISTDIEKLGRNSLTPTIGASEPVLIEQNDAGITSKLINETIFCTQTRPIKFLLKNFGIQPLKKAVLKWVINGVPQADFNFSGNLSSGDSAVIDFGPFNFKGGKSYFFECFSTLPNGVKDNSNLNDTSRILLKARLKGIYTVGGVAPDFDSLKEVEGALKEMGMCGPVTFNLRNGTYTGIKINNIFGNSEINGITFQSESLDSSKVTIEDDGNSFYVSNARSIRFNKLAFLQKSPFDYYSLRAEVHTRNIEVTSCIFDKPTGLGYASLNLIAEDSLDGNYLVKNCVFKGTANFRISANSSVRAHGRRCVVTGNYVNNGRENEISYIDSIAFIGNTTATIIIAQSNKELFIEGNKINNGNISAFCEHDSLDTEKIICNNVVNNGRLTLGNLTNVKIYHNTILSATDNIDEASLQLYGKISKQQIRNNIFVNLGKSLIYLIDDDEFNSLDHPNVFDYNTVYSPHITIQSTWNPHFWKSKFTKWEEWKSYAGQDKHSLFFMPQFLSQTDLHLLNDKRLNNSGQANAIVPFDLDNNLRNKQHPDPGAYEFNSVALPDDAGIISVQSELTNCDKKNILFRVVLKNFGSTNLTSTDIAWKLNDVTQLVYHWTGNLFTDSSTTVTLINGIINWDTINRLQAYTQLPNGHPDSDAKNDTLTTIIALPALNGIYTIGNVNADFKSFDDAVEATMLRGVCGPVVFKMNPGNYINVKNTEPIFKNVRGNNAINTITFESSTGQDTSVVITFDFFTFTKITGVIFRNLTFKGRFILDENTRSILFEGNRIITNTFDDAVVSHQYNENVQFINNHFSNAKRFFSYTHLKGNKYPKRLVIKGNTFDEPYTDAIVVNTVDSLIIDSNYFYKQKINGGGRCLILNNDSYFKISRNTIAGEFELGIQLQQPVEVLPVKGISSVENNTIMVYDGIVIQRDRVNVFYNSVYARSGYTPFILVGYADSVCNNIFVSENGYASGIIAGAGANYLEHNIYFTNGQQLMNVYNVEYSNLSTYTAATGFDKQSFMLDPQFVSVVDDLHYQSSTLDGKALPLKTVTIDLKGVKRHFVKPNPGAFEINKTIGIDKLEAERKISIYPNPFRNKVTVSYSLISKSEVKIEVLNELGQQIRVVAYAVQPAGEYSYTLDSKYNEQAGIYFMKITIDGTTSVKKIVKM